MTEIGQPSRYICKPEDMTVAISSLSFGGAEKIVVDWISRIYPKWRPRLIVLRDRVEEWPIPDHIHITRLHGHDLLVKLREVGEEIVASSNPTCVCHLLNQREREALAQSGVKIVPVIHNAQEGWLDKAHTLNDPPSSSVIAVSQDCATSLRRNGWTGDTSIIRHIPMVPKVDPSIRAKMRREWKIPKNATVIGMVGAVKPQKNYTKALHVLKEFLKFRDAYLVILGGPVSTSKGKPEWQKLVKSVYELGLRHRVALPGFVPNASSCLPAFDIVLNTSLFEGLSIATLEALIQGIPVVASKVGGQGELYSCGMELMNDQHDTLQWALALNWMLGTPPETVKPSWINFPSHRLWTLAGLARPVKPTGKVLFVTANLNSGGAQRSLVNLIKMLIKENTEFEVAVTGNSLSDYFYKDLQKAGVTVERVGQPPWDPFDYAENLVQKICLQNFERVCFWNVNAKIKLLTVKALSSTNVHFTDVSPGDFLYDELKEVGAFQELLAFSDKEYFSRINQLVIKYHGRYPEECQGRVLVIHNGVPVPAKIKKDYIIEGSPKIAVCGRIAPTKFIIEIIESIKEVWKTIPDAELHIIGTAEKYHQEYMSKVILATGTDINTRIKFLGQDFEAIKKLPDYDLFVVLGENQGCPNALLEALSVGLPCIANDDGGTRELFTRNGGQLIRGTKPEDLAYWIQVYLQKRDLAWLIGTEGRKFVRKNFSMSAMLEGYSEVLGIELSWGTRLWNATKKLYYKVLSGTTAGKDVGNETQSYSLHEQRLSR
jgi:glycosyltransferase involved in cell wall biosynthesis